MGTQTFFTGIQEVSVFRGIQEVSTRRLRKELINHNLYLFAWPFKVDYRWPFVNNAKFKKYIFSNQTKTYLHSRHYFTSSNCIFMQLQGIVFIQLQRNDILVNCQGNTDSFEEHIFIHKKYNHLRQLYSDTKLYSFQGTLSVRSRKYTLVQWKHINSGKLYPFKEVFHLRLPYSLSGVFSYQPLTLLIRVGYPQTYISMESL